MKKKKNDVGRGPTPKQNRPTKQTDWAKLMSVSDTLVTLFRRCFASGGLEF
jgi:hypothetical protein